MTILAGAMLATLAAAAVPNALVGEWGGDHVALVVTARDAILKLDCAEGRFAMPVVIDRHGDFTSAGTLDRHRPGPTRADTGPAAPAARYRGHIARDELTLIVAADGADRDATYRLRRNARTKLVRCM